MDHSETKYLPKVDHTPAELDAPAMVLLRAAALIAKRGLAKFVQCDAQGRLCIYGALVEADGGVPWSNSADANVAGIYTGNTPDAVTAVRRVEASLGLHDASVWNNADERTKDEVVAKLRAVALGL